LLIINIIIIIFITPVIGYPLIYKYIDENGIIHFTDVPPSNSKFTSIKFLQNRRKFTYSSSKGGYRRLAEKIARRYSVDPELVKRIIEVESGWNPYAVSRKGAMGLMQIMPKTAKELGLRNPYNPEENIDAGVRYLKYLFRMFGDLKLALAAYNAGPAAVKQYGGIPPFYETINYVNKILYGYKGFYYNYKVGRKGQRETIYKVVLKDGTILFTNSPIYYNNNIAERF